MHFYGERARGTPKKEGTERTFPMFLHLIFSDRSSFLEESTSKYYLCRIKTIRYVRNIGDKLEYES